MSEAPPPDPARLARLRERALEHVRTRRLPHVATLLEMPPAKLERFLGGPPPQPSPATVAKRVRRALGRLVAGLPRERRDEGVAAMARTLRDEYAKQPDGPPAWVEALGPRERG